MFLITIISMIIGLSISFFLARRYDMSEKVDKGIGFCYWKLSYRRKLIIINIAFYKEFPAYSYERIIGVILFLPVFIQAAYNYKKWKDEITQEEDGKNRKI